MRANRAVAPGARQRSWPGVLRKHSAPGVLARSYSSSDWYAATVVCSELSCGGNCLIMELWTASIAEVTNAISGFSYFMRLYLLSSVFLLSQLELGFRLKNQRASKLVALL